MLFARICWSSDDSVSMAMPYGVPHIVRGIWAGDRFDVVRVDNVEAFVEGEEWVDVTGELKKHVETIFAKNGQFEGEGPIPFQ
ncbi:hypothetical protein BDQ17DRAFT_1345320 [Cyathus striatus]|nr:hypothetical protein BDQ17DRAFT_1345320 [Cyathus striatus]